MAIKLDSIGIDINIIIYKIRLFISIMSMKNSFYSVNVMFLQRKKEVLYKNPFLKYS